MEVYKNSCENKIDKIPEMKELGVFNINDSNYDFYVSEDGDDQALYLMVAKLDNKIKYYGYARYKVDPEYCTLDFYKSIIDSKIKDIEMKSKALKNSNKYKAYCERLLKEGDKLEDEYRHAVHMSMMHVINWMDN